MNILSSDMLPLKGLVMYTYSRFGDERGYFTETFNNASLQLTDINHKKVEFVQSNESFSRKNVVRGLHFQWEPYMGKLIRTVYGHMRDMVVDIRPDSPTFGKGMIFDMPGNQSSPTDKLLWIPPGFAHGNYFLEDTLIQYFCTGTYNPKGEMCVQAFDTEIDWSLSDSTLAPALWKMKTTAIRSAKDKAGISLSEWRDSEHSKLFISLI